MDKHNTVFNDQLELFGLRYITKVAPIPPGPEFVMETQRKLLLSILFEQFLLFDSVVIKLERSNLGLQFIISVLGIDKVENLIERGVVKLLLWTPLIVSSIGRKNEDGVLDESVVIGTPPLVAGNYIESDSDPEKNIETALSYFNISRERKRIFIRKVRDKYLFPKNELTSEATTIIIDSYKNNRLENLGLKYEKEPQNLNVAERGLLQKLGHDVLDTSVLADMGFKSYNKYSIYDISESSIRQIESAMKISDGTSQIFRIENVPDIKSLVLDNILSFDSVFDLRYKSVAKSYRKWINSVSNNEDALPITKEYIDALTGKNKFFESSGGKFMKTLGMFGVGAALGAFLGPISDLGLGLFDTYILDGILKGWNPQMFVDEIRKSQSSNTTE
ncbi:MAG: hypothetical protein JST50_11425 [Bacteroidetes bacterium]|jgi:hypothetical protein|nr:hypothetical protein [Bacteroidota bacterium]